MISQFLSNFVDLVWGLPLVILLVGGGLYLTLFSGLKPMKGIVHSFRLITGRFHHGDGEGVVSHFQALSNALASTIGLGNISGVAIAITQGGPGAVFWMWVAAVVGMITKFFECSLSVMYRGKTSTGLVQGGPMYVIEKNFPKFKIFAIFFAVCGLIGTMAMLQVNQISAFNNEYYGVPEWASGLFFAVTIAFILFGGVPRLSRVTSKLVPAMCVFYVASCLFILFSNFASLPGMVSLIFKSAFNPDAVWGSAMGLGFMAVLQTGVKRAAFSNEAGIGTAPMAHGDAKTPEPIAEGFVAMIGPLLDTIIVCTMTALVILVTLDPSTYGDKSGILLTTSAFSQSLGSFGVHALGLSAILFGFTTMLGMANYNLKCWNYLFSNRKFATHKIFVIYYAITLLGAAVIKQDDVINILDIAFGLMAVPNMIATLILAPKVKAEMNKYIVKYL